MISENIRVFWQPHWTSCIRVKDYLKQRGIKYESVNIVEDGMEDLQKLGTKSVPVVSRGDKFVKVLEAGSTYGGRKQKILISQNKFLLILG